MDRIDILLNFQSVRLVVSIGMRILIRQKATAGKDLSDNAIALSRVNHDVSRMMAA